MLIRFGELLDRRMTKLIQNRLPMTQKETVEEALQECRNRERIKNGLPPLAQPTSFAKATPAQTALEPANQVLLQMPRPSTASPYSQATHRSTTMSQSTVHSTRDMTGRLRYDGFQSLHQSLQGATLPANLQVGKGANAESVLGYSHR